MIINCTLRLPNIFLRQLARMNKTIEEPVSREFVQSVQHGRLIRYGIRRSRQ